MLKIKLYPIGKKNQPKYRIVILEAKSKRNGKYLDNIGFYDPLTNPKIIKFDINKYQDWVNKGAQPTQTIYKLYKKYEKTS